MGKCFYWLDHHSLAFEQASNAHEIFGAFSKSATVKHQAGFRFDELTPTASLALRHRFGLVRSLHALTDPLRLGVRRWRSLDQGELWHRGILDPCCHNPARLKASASDLRKSSRLKYWPFWLYMSSSFRPPSRINAARLPPNISICRSFDCFLSHSA